MASTGANGTAAPSATRTPSPDLVNRQFTVDAPNRLWITDITEHPTAAGKVYCAAVMDAYSRLIVGYPAGTPASVTSRSLSRSTCRSSPAGPAWAATTAIGEDTHAGTARLQEIDLV